MANVGVSRNSEYSERSWKLAEPLNVGVNRSERSWKLATPLHAGVNGNSERSWKLANLHSGESKYPVGIWLFERAFMIVG